MYKKMVKLKDTKNKKLFVADVKVYVLNMQIFKNIFCDLFQILE